ncbi:MAG: NAD(P)/FAD-dependent oxidoreductase [Actinobacteria bacterium]|nr:MAG: NAD(P)/FAD-dependent oxidoreductase [Actinomycetota bacterium]
MERVDVFVIGGGGTGSDVTGALVRAGMRVAMAERDQLGGECAHYGCDPTKAMLKAARVAALARRASDFGIRIPTVEVDLPAVMARIRRMIEEETANGARPYEENGAEVFMQEARLTGEHRVELADGTLFEADRVVLATGSEPTAPPIPGLDGSGYWTNKEAIWHEGGLPSTLLVLGGGAIGVEFSQIYARFGSSVTLIEALPQILPAEDADSAPALADALVADGVHLHVGIKATNVERPHGRWRVTFEGSAHDVLEADALIVATGRKPCFDGHDLDAAGVEVDPEGKPILTETLRTTAPHIWAGGDATGELLFTHVANYEASVIVDDILGRPRPRDYRVVPKVTYSEPEVASVGLTEAEASEQHDHVLIGRAPFAENSRSFIEGERAGHVKLVADGSTGELLGGHIVGEHADELIHEVVAIMAARAPAPTIGTAIHAYPTLAETVQAAFADLTAKMGA